MIPDNFLKNTDTTGRFTVTSSKTGVTYLVEPIGWPKTKFGDINPATKKVEGNYGSKYRGSIDEDQSLIDNEKCHKVYELSVGVSPLEYIERLDQINYKKGLRPKA